MKIVEVVPLAFMRGRTLNDAFIILDEAQNTTPAQMKMFLTRLGARSKAVVTGDITQTDLPSTQPSGLVEVSDILRGIEGIAFIHLTERDVVRNPLVQRIVKAYEHQQQACEVLSNVVDGKRAHPTNSGCLLHLAVDEWDTLDDLGDELVAVESVPVFLRIGGQFEDHAKGGYA